MPARLRLLAAFAVLLSIPAWADEGAYLTLLSMGRAAENDRGPDPGLLSEAPAAARARAAAKPESPALGECGPDSIAISPSTAGRRSSASSSGTVQDSASADAPASPPAALRRRRWALRISTLAPVRRAASSFSPPDVSTAAVRPERPAEAAARAGARRGAAELFSAASFPAAP